MNKENDYSKLLAQANQDLKPFFVDIVVYDPDNTGEYNVDIRLFSEDGAVIATEEYAYGYYIDELPDVITEAWAAAKKDALQTKREMRDRAKAEMAKRFMLTNDMHMLGETIQEITLYAWPIIYGPENKYDQDSRDVLGTIRDWAGDFECWWMTHDESWRDGHDYLEEIDAFTDKKCKEYLEEIGVDPETTETKIFDETGHLIVTTAHKAPAASETGEQGTTNGEKDFIVNITRIEKYEGTVSVKATSKKEAEEKVKDAWGDGKHLEIYEDMTENINCDSQTYDAHEAQPGEKADFAI